MVQTLAALLSWIAMLALISIAVLLSGIWRPRARESATIIRLPRLQTVDQARAQAEAVARAQARTQARNEQLRQRRAA